MLCGYAPVAVGVQSLSRKTGSDAGGRVSLRLLRTRSRSPVRVPQTHLLDPHLLDPHLLDPHLLDPDRAEAPEDE